MEESDRRAGVRFCAEKRLRKAPYFAELSFHALHRPARLHAGQEVRLRR